MTEKEKYKDPPPAGVKPDPAFVPEVDEWCWVRRRGEWELRKCNGVNLWRDSGYIELCDYKGNMLPAEPPE